MRCSNYRISKRCGAGIRVKNVQRPSLMRTRATLSSRLFDVNAVEQVFERALVDFDARDVLAVRLRHSEDAAVEALVEQAQAAAVEEDDLERVALLAEEDKQRAAPRISADPVAVAKVLVPGRAVDLHLLG